MKLFGLQGVGMKLIISLLLLLTSHSAYAITTDDGCKLYICLMGSSESDGGSDCQARIKAYLNKFNGSCPDLPTCIGTSGPTTSGVLMVTASATGVSTQGPENGSIIQGCVEEDTWWGTYCEILLVAPATTGFGFNEATCGGS